MEYEITVNKKYLGIPVNPEQELKTLEVWKEDKKWLELRIPVGKEEKESFSPDYYSYVNVQELKGHTLILKGDFTNRWQDAVVQKEEVICEELERPLLHFTAQRGWINDPNGLVFQNGIYHLYFQYNPFNTEWENMSWGHAVSKDLIHWSWQDTVMYPDEDGTIFSGSAIVNERGTLGLAKEDIIYFYTAAGGSNQWSKGKAFTQRYAYSKDGGQSLRKLKEPVMDTICQENRDPKVFWHEESEAYVMVLWLEKNEFAVFRSNDLEQWECSQRIELEDAWECPDLVELSTEDGEKKWVFESADGYYFIGSFDGYSFLKESERLTAYGTKLPYAAQSYSGTGSRIISVPWLRTKHKARQYTGAMGLPRELSLGRTREGLRMKLLPVREYEMQKQLIYTWEQKNMQSVNLKYDKTEDNAFETEIKYLENASESRINILGQEIIIAPDGSYLLFDREKYTSVDRITQISVIFDKGIVELTCNYGMLYLTFETEQYCLKGNINVSGDNIETINIYCIE